MQQPPRPRGVYVDRTVAGAIEILAWASDGRELMRMVVDPSVFDPRLVKSMERWLDTADPQLAIVRG